MADRRNPRLRARRAGGLGIVSLLIAACSDDGGAGGPTGSGAGPGDGCSLDAAPHTGEGTYYDADGTGNCSFPAAGGELLVAAMNDLDYDAAAACGACVRVTGPDGEVTVRIVDRCPECPRGDVDMSPQAFERIAPLDAGRIPIRWEIVACGLAGPLAYHFKEGSNPSWTAVQVRNHRYPIARFEYEANDGALRAVAREDYNYFVEPNGMGAGPFTFRVTDVLGHVVRDSAIPFVENGEVAGASQFPACSP